MPAHRRERELLRANLLTDTDRDQDAQQPPQCGFGCIDRNAQLTGGARPVGQSVCDTQLGGGVERGRDAVRGDQIEERESVLRVGHDVWSNYFMSRRSMSRVISPTRARWSAMPA